MMIVPLDPVFESGGSVTDLLYQLARGTTLTVTDTNLTARPQLFYKLKVVLTP